MRRTQGRWEDGECLRLILAALHGNNLHENTETHANAWNCIELHTWRAKTLYCMDWHCKSKNARWNWVEKKLNEIVPFASSSIRILHNPVWCERLGLVSFEAGTPYNIGDDETKAKQIRHPLHCPNAIEYISHKLWTVSGFAKDISQIEKIQTDCKKTCANL